MPNYLYFTTGYGKDLILIENEIRNRFFDSVMVQDEWQERQGLLSDQ